jgi:murein DD-endopeptidase MepM/ murein hydrolase activator NlpD
MRFAPHAPEGIRQMNCTIAPVSAAPVTTSGTPVPAILQPTTSVAGVSGGGPTGAPDLQAALEALHGALGSLRGALEGATQISGGGGSGCGCGQATAGAGALGAPTPEPAAAPTPAPAPAPTPAPSPAPAPAPATSDWKAPAGFKLQNPLPGARTSSGFGEVSSVRNNRPHGGHDLAMGSGTPIKAAAPGKVVEAKTDGDGYGNYITIDHGNGWYTRYAHMVEKTPLKEGDVVTAGQQIGKVGSTGNSTGPHLHFEVLKGGLGSGNRQDPAPFLKGDKTF